MRSTYHRWVKLRGGNWEVARYVMESDKLKRIELPGREEPLNTADIEQTGEMLKRPNLVRRERLRKAARRRSRTRRIQREANQGAA